MSQLARQVAELACAHLPPALLGAEAEAMVAAAGRLAPAPGLGFEFRLGPEGGPIDLSQRFRIADGAIAQLRWASERHAERANAEAAEAWRRVAAFTDFWEGSPLLIKELWLEIDADGPPFPSVFIYYDRPIADEDVLKSLKLLAKGVEPAWEASCAALALAAGLGLDAGRLAGMMLSRAGALRIMVRNPGAEGARRLLDTLGWGRVTEELTRILGEPRIARIVHQLVLDFAPHLLPIAGIEMIAEQGVDGAACMRGVLDWMVEHELADPGRAAAIVEWSGAFGPSQARAAWPDAMIVRDLIEDKPPLAWQRLTNHLKLNLAPGCRPLAKAYLALFEGSIR